MIVKVGLSDLKSSQRPERKALGSDASVHSDLSAGLPDSGGSYPARFYLHDVWIGVGVTAIWA